MEVNVIQDSIIVETIRALWRKRDIKGALALVVRIPDPVQQKLWEATILLAQAELSGEVISDELEENWFDDLDLESISEDIRIDMQLVTGRIAMAHGRLDRAEDYFFDGLLRSRTSDYLLGKVQSMVGLGLVKLKNNQFEQADDLAVTATSLAEKLPDKNRRYVEAEVLLLQCKVYLSVLNYEKLEPKAKQLLELSQECGETLKYVQAQNHIAVVHASKGNYKIAMPYFLEALDICNQIEYHSLAFKIATNIATIHGQLHNYDEALMRYHSILEEYQAPIRLKRKAVILNNIGNLYVRLGKWKEAISYFLEAERIADDKDYMPLKKLAFCQVARCLVESGSYDAYLTHMRSEENLFDRDSANGLQILHYTKAKYALSQKKYDEAIRWGNQAIEVAEAFNDDTTCLHTQSILAEAHEQSGHLEEALTIYKQHARKKEALEKERVDNMIMNTEIDYILVAKEKEIQTLQRENQLQAELIKSTSLIRKKNKELVAKNDELSYFSRMIAVDFNKHLRVIKQFVGLLNTSTALERGENATEYLSYIRQAVDKVSRLVDGLQKYAVVVDEPPLGRAIKVVDILDVVSYDLKDLLVSHQVRLEYEDDLPALACGKGQLVVVFKELIINALQFVGDRQPVIHISSHDLENEIVLHITDNGVGIPIGDERKIFWAFYRSGRLPDAEGNGLGLAACKKIIENNGGRIKATNAAPEGLTVSIFWPKECHSIEDS